jgi:hypothetical protein
VDGGPPGATAAAPGDVLVLRLEGAAGTSLAPSPPGGGQYTFSNRQPVSFSNIEVSDNLAAPSVRAAQFRHAGPHQVSFTFSEALLPAPTAAALQLVNGTTGAMVPATNLRASFDYLTNTATFSFPGYPSGLLPNGNYRATIVRASVTDAAGNFVAANFDLDFFVLTGDVNRDRTVNGSDFSILASNFGGSGRTYEQGDLNGDGAVNGSDFALLSALRSQRSAARRLGSAGPTGGAPCGSSHCPRVRAAPPNWRPYPSSAVTKQL